MKSIQEIKVAHAMLHRVITQQPEPSYGPATVIAATSAHECLAWVLDLPCEKTPMEYLEALSRTLHEAGGSVR